MEAGIAPIIVIRGPRQIGKTTAQFQIIQDLLSEGVTANRILRVQFDDLKSIKGIEEPILRISDWFERHITPDRFNTIATEDRPAFLFFDEVQNLDSWDTQLKSLVDNASVQVNLPLSSFMLLR